LTSTQGNKPFKTEDRKPIKDRHKWALRGINMAEYLRMNVRDFINFAEPRILEHSLDPNKMMEELAFKAGHLSLLLGGSPLNSLGEALYEVTYPLPVWFLVFGWELCQIEAFLKKQSSTNTGCTVLRTIDCKP
jgi:hypothetical protein